MNKCSTEVVIGMDQSDKKSEICKMNYTNGETAYWLVPKNSKNSSNKHILEWLFALLVIQ